MRDVGTTGSGNRRGHTAKVATTPALRKRRS
jgi:hypothetical protein